MKSPSYYRNKFKKYGYNIKGFNKRSDFNIAKFVTGLKNPITPNDLNKWINYETKRLNYEKKSITKIVKISEKDLRRLGIKKYKIYSLDDYVKKTKNMTFKKKEAFNEGFVYVKPIAKRKNLKNYPKIENYYDTYPLSELGEFYYIPSYLQYYNQVFAAMREAYMELSEKMYGNVEAPEYLINLYSAYPVLEFYKRWRLIEKIDGNLIANAYGYSIESSLNFNDRIEQLRYMLREFDFILSDGKFKKIHNINGYKEFKRLVID